MLQHLLCLVNFLISLHDSGALCSILYCELKLSNSFNLHASPVKITKITYNLFVVKINPPCSIMIRPILGQSI